MTRAVLLLVLLVSTAHAMVHVFELSLPSVEQNIAAQYRSGESEHLQRELSGSMANTWRLPFGLGALFAGLLVDRFGGRVMLAVYLLGCGAMCIVVATVEPLAWLFMGMFAMGSFASIYHPAGLALISHEVEPESLPRALGLHGIFGSLGIGGAPFIVGAILSLTGEWRTVYWVLSIPGFLLGGFFLVLALRRRDKAVLPEHEKPIDARHEQARWGSFFTLTVFAVLMGFVYAAVVAFLPRYMSKVDLHLSPTVAEGARNYLAGAVLFVGCVGQYLAGRYAVRSRLEQQLTLISLGNAPGLVAMAMSTGIWRVAAAIVFALIHFMHQPIYNSLIAKYTPKSRRSLCYGFSFAMGFGIGSFGARFAGYSPSDAFTFGTLACVVIVAAGLCGLLWRWNRSE